MLALGPFPSLLLPEAGAQNEGGSRWGRACLNRGGLSYRFSSLPEEGTVGWPRDGKI